MKCKTITLLMMLIIPALLVSAQGTRVEPGTSVKVETGTTLDIGAGNLVLESDATGDASLLDNGSITYSGAGEAEVQRYLTEGRWHLISSPISGAVSGMFLADYLQQHSELTNGWTFTAAVNAPLATMQGYSLWSIEAAPSTEVFSGVTQTGNHSKSFTQSGAGWNLMGNPYPSVLDWDAVTLPAQLNAAIWLWDPTIGVDGDYRYYIPGGGLANTTTQFIPSGQGFFVKAVGGAGNLSLDNAARVHGGQTFYKSDENEAMLVLLVSGNEVTTQTAIRFNENATQEVDRLYDVYKIISGSPEVPVLFTKSASSDMAINTLPSIEGNEVVPVWFTAGTNGEYVIDATQMETFDYGTPIYLEDVENGVIQDLRQTAQYKFTYQTGTDKSFLVYFTDPSDYTASTGGIRIYAESSNLHVNFPASYLTLSGFNAKIQVYDISGRIVLQTETGNLNNTVPYAGNNNIYVVKVITDSETANGKVFLK